jgi:hypothetical protein
VRPHGLRKDVIACFGAAGSGSAPANAGEAPTQRCVVRFAQLTKDASWREVTREEPFGAGAQPARSKRRAYVSSL